MYRMVLLVGIIHVVVDGVIAGLVWARIQAGRATRCIVTLSRGIADKVTTASAAALESVEKVEPVSNLVDSSSTQVVWLSSSARNSLRINNATVLDEGGGSSCHTRLGEVAVAKSSAAIQLGSINKVEVESAVISLAELPLHRNLAVASSPVGVCGEIGACQSERNAVGAIRIVHVDQLVLQLLLGNVLGRSRRDNVEIGVDSDRGPGGDSGGFLNGLESSRVVQLFRCRIRDGATRGKGHDTGGAEKDSEERLGNHDESGVVVRLKIDEDELR